MYVDFTYYENSFGGTTIPSTLFDRYELKSRVFLDNITFDRLQADATLITDTVKNCLCEIIECNYNLDKEKEFKSDGTGKEIASETTDNHSVTYSISDKEKNEVDKSRINKAKFYNIAKYYLSNTDLLYKGV